MIRIIALPLLLSGCHIYGSMGLHDPSFDSEFKQEPLLATVGASHDMTEHATVYIQHQSQPASKEYDGFGLNEVGLRLRAKLW